MFQPPRLEKLLAFGVDSVRSGEPLFKKKEAKVKLIEQNTADVVVSLSNEEMRLIIGSLEVTLAELDDCEFSTRIGYERHEMASFLKELKTIAGKLGED